MVLGVKLFGATCGVLPRYWDSPVGRSEWQSGVALPIYDRRVVDLGGGSGILFYDAP